MDRSSSSRSFSDARKTKGKKEKKKRQKRNEFVLADYQGPLGSVRRLCAAREPRVGAGGAAERGTRARGDRTGLSGKNITLSDVCVDCKVTMLSVSSVGRECVCQRVRDFSSESCLFPLTACECRVRSRLSDAFINERIVAVTPVFVRESEPC